MHMDLHLGDVVHLPVNDFTLLHRFTGSLVTLQQELEMYNLYIDCYKGGAHICSVIQKS